MENFNHIVLFWIALWAIIQAALTALLIVLFSKIAGKLTCKMVDWAELIPVIIGGLIAIHFWTNHQGGWIFFGLAIGLYLSGRVEWLFPRPEDWDASTDF